MECRIWGELDELNIFEIASQIFNNYVTSFCTTIKQHWRRTLVQYSIIEL
jgi:hypothetical protein